MVLFAMSVQLFVASTSYHAYVAAEESKSKSKQRRALQAAFVFISRFTSRDASPTLDLQGWLLFSAPYQASRSLDDAVLVTAFGDACKTGRVGFKEFCLLVSMLQQQPVASQQVTWVGQGCDIFSPVMSSGEKSVRGRAFRLRVLLSSLLQKHIIFNQRKVVLSEVVMLGVSLTYCFFIYSECAK